jgi:L-arabinokinase
LPPTVVFYVSGHGFGHAVRQITIINALRDAVPQARVMIRTTAPSWLFDRTIRGPFELLPGETDTGVVQIDSLHLDERETIVRARAFQRRFAALVPREAALLRSLDASFVVVDAAPLGCAAAAAANVPSVVCANFTWDWIYRGYGEQPGVAELTASIGASYALASAAWRMPVHGGFETVREIIDIPLVARHGRAPGHRDSFRTQFGLPPDRPLALVSFGGYGVRQLPLERLDCLDDWDIVVSSAGEEAAPLPKGVHHVREDVMYASGLRYEDLVGTVDVVITKPGYGILSDCIANGAAMLYTPRGRFAEYDVMVAEMPGMLRCHRLELDAFEDGRWSAGLRELSGVAAPPLPRTDGAAVVAAMIADRLSAP